MPVSVARKTKKVRRTFDSPVTEKHEAEFWAECRGTGEVVESDSLIAVLQHVASDMSRYGHTWKIGEFEIFGGIHGRSGKRKKVEDA